MKLLIDTCVLFPTVMRHALLGACKIQGWTPLWSERILEEWAHSARKLGPEGEIQARGEIALLKACLLYTSPSPRDLSTSRMPSSA